MHRPMMRIKVTFVVAALAGLICLAAMIAAGPENPVPPAPAAGDKIKIGPKPAGKIAFINEGDIWIMDADGRNRQKVCDIDNARGRMSFSPDNKRIVFTREGKDGSNLPSGEGGAHLLHDLFIAYLDSAATNSNWWTRLTKGLGGAYPEWSYDGAKIYYQNDINAGMVDYLVPTHQIAVVDANGANSEYLRKDWQRLNMSMLLPAVSRDGQKIAFVINYSSDPERYTFQNFGIKIMNLADIMAAEPEMRKPSPGLREGYAPSWSPDNQWLAFVSNDMRNQGIFIIHPDLTGKRLIYAPPATAQVSAAPVGWSPDSRWIVFAISDGTIYTIDINGENLTPLTGSGIISNPAWSK